MTSLGRAVLVVALSIGLACTRGSDVNIGTAKVAIRLAPPTVRCITVDVAGLTTVHRPFDVVAEGSTTFALDGLPVGADVFTAEAYPVTCEQLSGGSVPPTFASDPITAVVVASPPVGVDLIMKAVGGDGGAADVGRATVAIDFPEAGTTGPAGAVITEFILGALPNPGPTGIASGPGGNLWVSAADGVASVSTAGVATPQMTERENGLVAVAADGDDGVWFAGPTSNVVRRYSVSTGSFKTYPVSVGGPGLAIGPDGNLWLTEANNNLIGRLTPAGALTEFPILPGSGGATPPPDVAPSLITAGSDGNMWFTEFSGGKIGRISPSGEVVAFPLAPGAQPSGICTGADGNIWFTEYGHNLIGRITPTGAVTEFPIPTAASNPACICPGPDGNLWFTEASGNNVGRITPSGLVTEFQIPTASSGPVGITAGPDGNIWFVEQTGNHVARLAL